MKQTIKTMTTVFAGLALTLGLTFTSCKKAETGPAGAAGTNGTNGNANVKTKIYTVTPGQWNGNSTTAYGVTVNVPEISNAETEAVIIYYSNTASGGYWYPLATEFSTSGSGSSLSVFQFVGAIKTGILDLSWTDYYNSLYHAPSGTLYFKIVVIPPAKVISNVNTKDYNQVKAAYNLKD